MDKHSEKIVLLLLVFVMLITFSFPIFLLSEDVEGQMSWQDENARRKGCRVKNQDRRGMTMMVMKGERERDR